MSREASLVVLRQFQSETDAIREAPEPLAARATVFVLAGLLAAGIAVSALARVDRVITSAAGKIVSTEDPSVYQALDPSIIKSIDVREGDLVTTGQLLATLDPTFAAADVDQLRQQTASLEAEIARAEAEQANRPLTFETRSDASPASAHYEELQRALYDQRAATLKAQLQSYDEKISEANATIAKLQQDEARYAQREKIAQQIEAMRQKLNDTGSGSLLNLLLASDNKVESLRTMEFDHNSLLETQHTLSSLIADREATLQQWYAAVSQEIVTAQSQLDAANAQLTKAVKHQDLVRLTAAEPSMVINIAKLNVGSVLKEGDELLRLVPLRTPLEAEVDILSRDVGFVRPGDPATLKVDAFNYFEHGVVEGSVRWISESAFTTDADGKPVDPYYKARVKIDKVNFVGVPQSFRFIPGMTLTADVKVGTRSMLRYILGGLSYGAGESMREP